MDRKSHPAQHEAPLILTSCIGRWGPDPTYEFLQKLAWVSVSLDIRMLSPQQKRRGDKSTVESRVCPFCLESSLRQRVRAGS